MKAEVESGVPYHGRVHFCPMGRWKSGCPLRGGGLNHRRSCAYLAIIVVIIIFIIAESARSTIIRITRGHYLSGSAGSCRRWRRRDSR